MLGRISSTQSFSGTDLLYAMHSSNRTATPIAAGAVQQRSCCSRYLRRPLRRADSTGLLCPTRPGRNLTCCWKARCSISVTISKKMARSEGVVKVSFNLIDSKTRRVMASRMFVSSVPASDANAPAAAMALNQSRHECYPGTD